MSDHLFASAWLKWGQAVKHSQTLETQIEEFRSGDEADPLMGYRAEYVPRRHGFSVVPEMVNIPPVRWQLLLGDVANNYRAALDHLAWALVVRGRTPPRTLTPGKQKGIVFPIFTGRQEFNRALGRKLPGARRADVATVRKQQPYHYSDRTRERHALALLARINNWDKHRTIEPIWDYPARVDIEVTDARDCSFRRLGFLRRPGPIEPGKELAFIRARKTGPNPAIEVNIRLTPEPCLDNSIGVTYWVNICGILIWRLLGEFSGQPPEIVDLGAELTRWRPGSVRTDR